MQLSKNFSLNEFTKSSTALRRGIDNSVKDKEHLENLKHLVEHICQPTREYFGKPVIVTSGYRSPELNAAIGGSATSQHCKGEAVDMEIPGVSNVKLANWITNNCNFDQVILEFYNPDEGPNSGWVHASLKREGENRKMKMVAYTDGSSTKYTQIENWSNI